MKKMLVFILANPFVGCFNALEFHFSSSWKKKQQQQHIIQQLSCI